MSGRGGQVLELAIPGFRQLELTDAVCDYNGTLAFDGVLIEGVGERMRRLASHLRLHVVTADTFGTVVAQLHGLPCTIVILDAANQAEAKRDFVQRLGAQRVAAIGNGRNDRMMLGEAALGIAVCGGEGIAADALQASDVVVGHIADALDLLLHPTRLLATLRA
ncbi:MAG TPA: ATPase P [Casimicrobiaceae bacterium]